MAFLISSLPTKNLKLMLLSEEMNDRMATCITRSDSRSR